MRRTTKLTTAFTALVLAIVLTATTAYAKPPPEHGTAPVATTPVPGLGQAVGSDLAARASCTVGGHHLLFLGGDVTGWQKQDGTHTQHVNRLFAITAATGQLVWAGPKVGPSKGWVQGLACRSYDHGLRAMVYAVGEFTRFMGASRNGAAAVAVNGTHGLKFSLSAWKTHSIYYGSRAVFADSHAVYIGDGHSIQALGLFHAKHLWRTNTNCRVNVVLVHAGVLYAGGYFTRLQNGSGSTLKHYGLARMSARTGALNRRFLPSMQHNEKLCNDPSAHGAQTYSGSVPASMAWDSVNGHLCVGMAGKVNRVDCFNPRTGASIWKPLIHDRGMPRLLDGDGQTVTVVGDYLFAGFHRSGGAIDNRRHNYGYYGAFFSLKTGVQAHWNISPDFAPGGLNRDHRNDGIIMSILIDHRLCVGGAFSVPAKQVRLLYGSK